MNHQNPKRLVLASASPRRRMLLEGIGFELDVRPADILEIQSPDEPATAMVERLARAKAWAVEESAKPILAADTAVVLRTRGQERVFGKPAERAEAAEILRLLSGERHVVLTGYCVRLGPAEKVGYVETQVWFRSLTEEQISAYLDTGESMDKAGAYGIQGPGGALVDRIEGSYSNVVGLPVSEVLWDLQSILETHVP